MENAPEIRKSVNIVQEKLPELEVCNPIQHDIIKYALQNMGYMFNNCQNLFDEKLVKLYHVGFKNEKNVKKLYETIVYTGILTFYDTYLKVIEDFGENTILITFSDFLNILDNYELVSGPLESYTGEVPDHVIDAILNANSKYISYVSPYLDFISEILDVREDGADYINKKVSKFPFFHNPREKCHINSNHASFRDCDEFQKFFDLKSKYGMHGWKCTKTNSHLFIAAPANEMKTLKFKVTPKTSDPLVCSLVPNVGIIVHASWGPEGNDIVLNLYRLLSSILKNIRENGIIASVFSDDECKKYLPSKEFFDFKAKH